MKEAWLQYLHSIEQSVKKILSESTALKQENAELKEKLQNLLDENQQQKKMMQEMAESNNFINIASDNPESGFNRKKFEEELDAAIKELNACIKMLNN